MNPPKGQSNKRSSEHDCLVAVIIPALNEERSVGEQAEAVCRQPGVTWVIVADNGSSDATASAAEKGGAIVVTEPRPGYGYACAAGSAEAANLGADIMVYMDADGSSLAEEMPRLLSPLIRREADLVLGSRRLGHIVDGAMREHQRKGNQLSSWLIRRLYQVEVTDLGPYRAIRADLLRALNMQEMTYGWPTEMMVKAAKRGARIVEVPVTWRSRQSGRSKVSGTVRGSVLAAYYILGVTLRCAFG